MKLSKDHQLETSRCILRYPCLDDCARLLSAFVSKNFPNYVPLGQIENMEQVIDWIEGSHRRWNTGQGYTWTADRKLECLVVGQVSLIQLREASIWSLAFWIHPDSWGQGFATEIASCVVECAFRELSATKVLAATAKWNKGSLQVLKKIGMKFLGENREGYWIDDEPIATKEFVLELADLDSINR